MASLEALAGFDHLQEVILQNFVPHRRYYGEEPADIATEAADTFWRTGLNMAPEHGAPKWATPVGIEDMKRLIAETRRLMPGVGIQVPPNLADWWPELVAAGATDLGGLSANGDHISPEHPFPSPHQVRKRLAEDGVALAERLCVYGRFIDPEWIAPRVLEVIRDRYRAFIPRRGAPATAPGHDRARPRRRGARAGRAGGVVRREPPGGDRGHPPGRRRAARRAGGETVTFVVNRNINVSNVCVVGCAFCGFGVGKRSPDAYEHDREEFVSRVHGAIDYGATEICMQSGIHPDWGLEDYLGWLRLAKEVAPEIHLHAYSPMEISHMCDAEGLPPAEVLARLAEAGLDSVPGTAAEVLDDGVRQRISPNKLPVARWVEIIEAAHRVGLRSTVTVMFGHIETPQELAEHMRVVRALQERTGGFTEFVPLSFIPFHTQLGRTHGIEEISREENLKHTAVFRLALGRTIPSLQASWVKMGLDAATEALRWGVNDLGGTLMEESISRMAGSYHGVRLDPQDLVAAAHAPAARRRAHHAVRHPPPLRAGGCRMMAGLVLGPMNRWASTDEATVWVETDAACEVEVRADGAPAARGTTFEVEGHHYAIVRVSGLPEDAATPYTVLLDGEQVWPEPDSRFPPSRLRTHSADGAARVVFGSCRTAYPHEHPFTLQPDEHECGREVDALRAIALRMADSDPSEWPHAVLLLGDQVYADEVSPDTLEFIRSRRDTSEPPGETIADFEEYTRLYHEAWSDPPIRWLLSTVPSAMIFDDHDVIDDWNTSAEWVAEMRATDWWDRRVVGALHGLRRLPALGQPQPGALDEEEVYQRVNAARDGGDLLSAYALQVRPRGRGRALELLPRHRHDAGRDDRLARRPRARRRAAAAWSTPASGSGSPSTRAAASTTC